MQRSLVALNSPLIGQAALVLYRAWRTQDDRDILIAMITIGEYAQMWQAMRAAAFLLYGVKPPQYAAHASEPYGGW